MGEPLICPKCKKANLHWKDPNVEDLCEDGVLVCYDCHAEYLGIPGWMQEMGINEPKEEPMNKDLLRAIQARSAEERVKSDFRNIAGRLQDLAKAMEEYTVTQPKYTGWFALFAKDGDSLAGYRFIGFFNPDKCAEDEEPEWDIALPIESEETIKEFMGW